MPRSKRTTGTAITFEGVTYPSVVALYRGWTGSKPGERTFASKLQKWQQRNPGAALTDADIHQLFKTRSGTHGITYKGVAYRGPKDLYRAATGEKISFGGFWFRLNEFKKSRPGMQPVDSDIEAMLSVDLVYYQGVGHPSLAQVYKAMGGHKIVLHRFVDNVRDWQNANPGLPLTDKILEHCCWFMGGEHARSYKGQSHPNLKALYDVLASPKCRWGTFSRRVHKLETLRDLADDDFDLLSQPQAKVKFFKGILYRWIHLSTGKIYIGISSQTLDERIRLHHRQARGGTYNPLSLQAAIARDGLPAFKIEVLQEFDNEDAMKVAEELAVREHDCLAPKGFNLQEGGRSWTKQGTDVEFEGTMYPSYAALAQAFGIPEKLLDGRRRLGWSLELALNTPPYGKNASHKPVIVQGVEYPTVTDAAKAYVVRPTTVYNRLSLGWSIEDALGLTLRQAATRKPVTVRGMEFKTISEAARHYGKNPREVFWKMDRGKTIEEALQLTEGAD